MRISIDTKEESLHELKKLVNLLQSLISHKETGSSVQPSSESSYVNMFAPNPATIKEPKKEEPQPSYDMLSMFGNTNTPETKVETPTEPEPPKQRVQIVQY